MAVDFVAALDEEIFKLERDLADDPRHVKLRELKSLCALYVSESGPKQPTISEPTLKQKYLFSVGPSVRGPKERNKAILDTAETIIRGRTKPTPTAALLTELETRGVTVHGLMPRNTLSAVLSKSENFHPHGRSGWTFSYPQSTESTNKAASGDSLSNDPPAAFGRVRRDSPENPTVRPVDPVPGGGT